jgi:hypothetical protein
MYGNGNDDVYNRLNNTREIGGARFPFIEDGRHKLALCTLEEFQHSSDGPCARALFEVLESNKHAVGTYVVKIWKLVKPPKFNTQPSDADKFADFCRKLKGAPVGHPIGNDIRVLMKERPRDQLARGTVIEANGVPNKKGNWVEIYWNAVPQAPTDIATMRQRLEQKGIPDTGAGPAQQPQAPAYGQAPQQGYQMGPQQYGQPQAPAQYPQQPPQGYGQAPAPQGPPPGGFLGNLPPNNGGNGQGGNGSW